MVRERARARRYNRVASGKRIWLQHAVTVARISGIEQEIQGGADAVRSVRVAPIERSYKGTMKMNSFVAGVVAGLTAAAVGQELAKEPSQRTWKGKVAGVPYNFRVAEWSDIANEYWNPSSDQILVPRAIGLGWGINFAAVARRVQGLMQTLQTTQPSDTTDRQRRIQEPVER
ncbi:MAG: hypothetical protein ACXVCO_07060 [Ktedonobacterales bacterium]